MWVAQYSYWVTGWMTRAWDHERFRHGQTSSVSRLASYFLGTGAWIWWDCNEWSHISAPSVRIHSLDRCSFIPKSQICVLEPSSPDVHSYVLWVLIHVWPTFRFLWPCIVRKVWRERKNQQDATIRCLLLTSISTCFGHHYVSSARILQRSAPQPLPTTSSRTRTIHQMQ